MFYYVRKVRKADLDNFFYDFLLSVFLERFGSYIFFLVLCFFIGIGFCNILGILFVFFIVCLCFCFLDFYSG